MTSTEILPVSGRSVDPGHLEGLGKQASRLSDSSGISLTEAVVQTIGHEKLNAEQVRRVVEYANIEAYNTKFATLGGPQRVVSFDGGPADPAQVMQSLNDYARPQEIVVEALDYAMPPEFAKSSSPVDFAVSDRTTGGVIMDVYGLRSKLSAAHDELVQSVEASKERLSDSFISLVEIVKSASAAGATSAEIYECWYRRNPEVAKVAFSRVQHFVKPNTKVAGRRISDDSKLARAFDMLVMESESCQGHVQALQRVEVELAKVSNWLQRQGGRDA
jgi:hypothetical protein